MGSPMRIRAAADGESIEVKILMRHEMETGRRKGPDGELVPALYIKEVTADYEGRRVFNGHWGPAVSKNPFLGFRFKAAPGGKLVVTWTDTSGDTRTDEATVA